MENDETFVYVKLIVGAVIAIVLVSGLVLAWVTYFGPLFNQADYNNFNSSQQHLNAVAQKLGDDCLQLAEQPQNKQAIEQAIYQDVQGVNLAQLNIPDSTRSCVNQAITDVTHP